MTNKTYRVLNTHDYKSQNKIVHEYTICVDVTDEGQVVTLNRSYDGVWSEDRRGEEVISLIDTGDYVIYPKKLFSSKFSGEVGYDLHAELFILLTFMNKSERMPLFQGIIEEITPTQTFEI